MALSTHISKTSPAAVLSAGRSTLLTRIDLRNLGLLVLGFVCVLLLVSPVRAFPIADDWIYAHSVGDMLKWDYEMPIESQANLVSHVAWGAIFAALFGNSFTVLTVSTLVMSLACLAIFYILLRHLDITPNHALLGAALLGFNPLYVFLSYSFMTELTFITYMLAACLFFVRGMRGYGEHWFWFSSVATGLPLLVAHVDLATRSIHHYIAGAGDCCLYGLGANTTACGGSFPYGQQHPELHARPRSLYSDTRPEDRLDCAFDGPLSGTVGSTSAPPATAHTHIRFPCAIRGYEPAFLGERISRKREHPR
jgi:hypothetical protein